MRSSRMPNSDRQATYYSEHGQSIIQPKLLDQKQPCTTSGNDDHKRQGTNKEDGDFGRLISRLGEILQADTWGDPPGHLSSLYIWGDIWHISRCILKEFW